MKSYLLHGVVAGILSALTSVIFLNVYKILYFVDYSLVINTGSIIGASIIGCVFMAIGYFLLEKIKKDNLIGGLNLVFIIVSFISIFPPMTMSLPYEVEFPELFPGLVIPMHFFPIMFFLGIAPFFKRNNIIQ